MALTGQRFRIRSGSGLGDSLYMQSVARHLIESGHNLEICSDWPDVFLPLQKSSIVVPFRRVNIDKVSHYTTRKGIFGTTQFQDCCLTAGITDSVDLRLDWNVLNVELVEYLQSVGKFIIVVQLPRTPMNRSDAFGDELLPDCSVIQKAIDIIGKRAFFVQVGKGKPLFEFSGIDFDISGRTSVSDLIDVASVASGMIGYASFIVPLAESLQKPTFLVWSRRGLNSETNFISSITPQKIIHRVDAASYVVDDCTHNALVEAVYAFCDKVRGRVAV